MDELIRAMSAFECGEKTADTHTQKIANFLCRVWDACTGLRGDSSRTATIRLLAATGQAEVTRIMSIYEEGEITKNFATRDRAVRHHIELLKGLLKKMGQNIKIA